MTKMTISEMEKVPVVWIIIKNGQGKTFDKHYPANKRFSLKDSIAHTYIGRELSIPEYFETFKEAQLWLEKAREYNPKGRYALDCCCLH